MDSFIVFFIVGLIFCFICLLFFIINHVEVVNSNFEIEELKIQYENLLKELEYR